MFTGRTDVEAEGPVSLLLPILFLEATLKGIYSVLAFSRPSKVKSIPTLITEQGLRSSKKSCLPPLSTADTFHEDVLELGPHLEGLRV